MTPLKLVSIDYSVSFPWLTLQITTKLAGSTHTSLLFYSPGGQEFSLPGSGSGASGRGPQRLQGRPFPPPAWVSFRADRNP